MKAPFFLIAAFAALGVTAATPVPEIIPQPQKIEMKSGDAFKIVPGKTTVGWLKGSADHPEEKALTALLCRRLGLKMTDGTADIQLSYRNFLPSTIDAADAKIQEMYNLSVDGKTISISGYTVQGLGWGVQTLMQLAPVEAVKSPVEFSVPQMTITDAPDYGYRGMHLDVCRHFYTVDEVKQFLDLMAMFKLNKFHWHLTDDQGWRIEIKKYPKLTEIGATRAESPTPRKRTVGDKTPYGPYFYTQEQAKEVVRYAQSLGIEVIPEIEMPGHARAALAAYPELGCTGGPYTVWTKWGIDIEAFCAGNDTTMQFMKDVVSEMVELFPSQYVHVGGDECRKDRWKKCAKCQARIKTHNLKDEHELQCWFITEMGKFIESKGKNMIGWDEILEGGIPPGAIIMSWRSTEGGKKAANAKHGVIMTPKDYCYHDYPQAIMPGEPESISSRLVTLPNVYSFDVSCGLPPETAKYIKGPQANHWSEYFYTTESMFYHTLPRLAAMAEVGWTPYAVRKNNFKDFERRLWPQYKRFKAMGVGFRFAPPLMPATVILDKELKLDFGTVYKDYKLFIKKDKGDKQEVAAPVTITAPCNVEYWLEMTDGTVSRPATIRVATQAQLDAEKAAAATKPPPNVK